VRSVKALRKGVSPVIATLLLILIAVAAAVLLYTWVSSLSANVAGSQVTGKTLTVIQATWAMGWNDGSTVNGLVDGASEFSADYPVLIISFKAPPATVGGGGAGSNLLTIDNVDVVYSGRVICHYNAFTLSTDDAQHVGTTAGGLAGNGLLFTGYTGSDRSQDDSNDLMPPGGIVVGIADTYMNAAHGNVTVQSTAPSYSQALFSASGYQAPSFVTVVAGVWEVQYVSTNHVETNFKSTTATIRFDRWTGLGGQQKFPYYDSTNSAVSQKTLDTFDLAKVGQDDWSLVVYCKSVNPNVMNSVDIRLQFQDGSTWSTTVPLTVQ
jgi:flagellin-like protein